MVVVDLHRGELKEATYLYDACQSPPISQARVQPELGRDATLREQIRYSISAPGGKRSKEVHTTANKPRSLSDIFTTFEPSLQMMLGFG
jgi:hypothetical protein